MSASVIGNRPWILSRLSDLDLAKAIAVFVVVWGHAVSGTANPLYRTVFYTFNMPLFFLVSGILTRRPDEKTYTREGRRNFFRKSFLGLVVPYLIWGLILSDYDLPNTLHLLYGSYQHIKLSSPVGALWYLPTFFLARVGMREVLWLCSKSKKHDRLFALLCALPAFAIGLLLPALPMGYPWGLNIAFTALGYLLIGYAIKGYREFLRQKSAWLTAGICLLCAAAFFCGTFLRADSLELVCFFKGDFGNPFWLFWNSLSGSFAVLTATLLISRPVKNRGIALYRAALWVGRNTMGIYLIHVPLMRQLAVPMLESLGFSASSWFPTLVAAVAVLLICCLLTALIRLIIPQLLGIFPPSGKSDRAS